MKTEDREEEISREEWDELYKQYPRDVVKHLLDRGDLLSRWAATVIQNLREK